MDCRFEDFKIFRFEDEDFLCSLVDAVDCGLKGCGLREGIRGIEMGFLWSGVFERRERKERQDKRIWRLKELKV